MSIYTKTLPGTPGVHADQIEQLFVPGRGRDETGIGLTPESYDRFEYAAHFFLESGLAGNIVCAGYKTPRDQTGEAWTSSDGETFRGIPEAYLGAAVLRGLGVPADRIRVEPHSRDTVGNFVLGRDLLNPNMTTGIVAQEDHLPRMLGSIAPRTLVQPFVGLVVPSESPRVDSLAARMHSWYLLRGMQPNHPRLREITDARSLDAWEFVLAVEGLFDDIRKLLHPPEKQKA